MYFNNVFFNVAAIVHLSGQLLTSVTGLIEVCFLLLKLLCHENSVSQDLHSFSAAEIFPSEHCHGNKNLKFSHSNRQID